MANFEVRSLSSADIALLMNLDEAIFPAEMLMTQDDYKHLSSIPGGIIIEVSEDGQTVGVAFGFPAAAMKAEIVEENDPVFDPRPGEFYSYSVGVLPSFQGHGHGVALAKALALEAKRQGWKFLSAHVRMRKGWAETRRQLFSPMATRVVRGYWEDPQELMEYQLIDLSEL